MVTFDELPRGFFRIRGVDGLFYKNDNGCYVSFSESWGFNVHFNFADNFQVAIFYVASII